MYTDKVFAKKSFSDTLSETLIFLDRKHTCKVYRLQFNDPTHYGMWYAGHCRLDGDEYKRKLNIYVA